jgi:hypothetical protein
MRTRLAVFNAETGSQLIIRPPIRPLTFSLLGIAVMALAGFALTAAVIAIVGRDPFTDRLFLGLLSVASMALAIYFAFPLLWRAIGKEVIDIGPTNIRITEIVGSRQLRQQTYDSGRIRNMRLEKVKYVAKGHPFSHDAIFFDYDGHVVTFAWRLSRQEARGLLEGPLGRFAEEGPR